MLGLVGAHRTGKTTLARVFAERHGMTFLETSTSKVFADSGIDPARSMTFEDRLDVQDRVVDALQATYSSLAPGQPAITDRTPIDALAYTLLDCVGDACRPEQFERLRIYTQRCFDLTTRHFTGLVLVQPGISIVPARGKALANYGLIEHLNSLALGLLVDERNAVPHFYISRRFTDVNERVDAINRVLARVSERALKGREAAVIH